MNSTCKTGLETRTPYASSNEKEIKRLKMRMNKGDAEAFSLLAGSYHRGNMGLPQDHQKCIELNLKAGELGCAKAYNNLGIYYARGIGVEIDQKKAKQCYELAAMGGYLDARHHLGCVEAHDGNNDWAKRHFIIAARAGHKESLDAVKEGYTNGMITKDEYANTLRAYHERHKEMKSDERDKAAQTRNHVEYI